MDIHALCVAWKYKIQLIAIVGLKTNLYGIVWHRPWIFLHVQSRWYSTWNCRRSSSLCAIQRKYKSQKILNSEKTCSKEIFLLVKCPYYSNAFTQQNTQEIISSQKTSHKTDPLGSWRKDQNSAAPTNSQSLTGSALYFECMA